MQFTTLLHRVGLAPGPRRGDLAGWAPPAQAAAGFAPAPPPGPGPVLLAGQVARQVDRRSCGAAVLVLLAALADRSRWAWLDADPSRFGAAQRRVHAATTRRALGPLRWPPALGTPPWGAARTARWGDVGYRAVLVDDTDRGLLAAALDAVVAALEAGFPVPLYVGGDSAGGLSQAVPRHVVLAVGVVRRGGTTVLRVYEPGAGAVREIDRDTLAAARAPHPALGGWRHLCWVLLPCR